MECEGTEDYPGCGKDTNNLWSPPKLCSECYFKKLAIDQPPPLFVNLKECMDPVFKGFKDWPNNYIPSKCPYCEGKLLAIPAGHYLDHSCGHHICKNCKVYFGWTD